jgi:hypothetical protein
MLNHLIAVLRRRAPSVVGVLPAQLEPAFYGNVSHTLEIWLPLGYRLSDESACRDCLHLQAIARLPPNADLRRHSEHGS